MAAVRRVTVGGGYAESVRWRLGERDASSRTTADVFPFEAILVL